MPSFVASGGIIFYIMEKNNKDIISFEDYMAMQVQDGYISEDGMPLKCSCGCKEFKQVNMYYGEGYIEEYSLECKKESCLKIVGT